MAMSTMKDHERLELLKEIGGTKVYEERRKESIKILHETDNRRQRILEVVSIFLPVCLFSFCLNMALSGLCIVQECVSWPHMSGCEGSIQL